MNVAVVGDAGYLECLAEGSGNIEVSYNNHLPASAQIISSGAVAVWRKSTAMPYNSLVIFSRRQIIGALILLALIGIVLALRYVSSR